MKIQFPKVEQGQWKNFDSSLKNDKEAVKKNFLNAKNLYIEKISLHKKTAKIVARSLLTAGRITCKLVEKKVDKTPVFRVETKYGKKMNKAIENLFGKKEKQTKEIGQLFMNELANITLKGLEKTCGKEFKKDESKIIEKALNDLKTTQKIYA